MTLPNERTRAVQYTQEFLTDLIDPLVTPGVPQKIREQARRLLRHYPTDFDFTLSAARCPDIWGPSEAMDPAATLSRRLLQSYFTVAEAWQIDLETAAALLGASSDEYAQLKSYPYRLLPENIRQRVVNLLHIHRALELLFDHDTEQRVAWLNTASDVPPFHGQTPLACMRQGEKAILETLLFVEDLSYPTHVLRELEFHIVWFAEEYRPEAQRRLALLKQGIAEGQLEGLPVSFETLSIFEKFVLLDLDAEELQQHLQELRDSPADSC